MGKGNILVVDDDSNLLEVIRMRLESAKYDVVTAQREEEALHALKEEVIDLSVIDLQLEKTDGISLMEQLHRINPDIPVVILTAYGTIESAVEAMRRGAYSYLTKPFDPRELLFQMDQHPHNQKHCNRQVCAEDFPQLMAKITGGFKGIQRKSEKNGEKHKN